MEELHIWYILKISMVRVFRMEDLRWVMDPLMKAMWNKEFSLSAKKLMAHPNIKQIFEDKIIYSVGKLHYGNMLRES